VRSILDSTSVKTTLFASQNPSQMVDVHGSLDSTNLEALRAPTPWRVVVADHQSAGRGRMSRQWQAPPGASIAVSCVVPMPEDRAADWGWLPLLAGMSMQQALADVAGVAGRLKWPNDVLVQEGRGGLPDDGAPWLKISGVLCEMVPGGGLVVIGAGANIDQVRSELPVGTATSLALCGASDVRREDVIVRYLGVLVDWHQAWSRGGAGLEALRAAYRSSCLTIGLDVDVHQPAGLVAHGTATAIDDTGRLVVTSGGTSTAHAAGDVTHVRRAEPAAGDMG
jgi:BirA family transcriptional regulator, biotin operon repressor / biotin---[acetyl-CoA-carboxylase] ligase